MTIRFAIRHLLPQLRRGALFAVPAALVLTAPGIAQAQYYQPYPPRGYYRPAPAPERIGPSDVRDILRSMGFVAINRPNRVGSMYVTEASDVDGVRVRVRVDSFSGDVISVRAIAGNAPVYGAPGAPVPPANVTRPPVKKPAAPVLVQPTPKPQRVQPQPVQPEVAAVPPAAPAAPATPPAVRVIPGTSAPSANATPSATPPVATAPTTTGSINPSVDKPAAAPAPAPAVRKPAVTAAKPAPAVKPVALAKPTSAGTGTPGDGVSAGSASVLSRGTTDAPVPKPPAN